MPRREKEKNKEIGVTYGVLYIASSTPKSTNNTNDTNKTLPWPLDGDISGAIVLVTMDIEEVAKWPI